MKPLNVLMCVAGVVVLLSIFMPAQANLSSPGKAMLIYATDYDIGEYPKSGGRSSDNDTSTTSTIIIDDGEEDSSFLLLDYETVENGGENFLLYDFEYDCAYWVCFTDYTTSDESASRPLAGYIKFDGVDGEAKDVDHDKWSDILSYSTNDSLNTLYGVFPLNHRDSLLVYENTDGSNEVTSRPRSGSDDNSGSDEDGMGSGG